jgi:hypothetical protein
MAVERTVEFITQVSQDTYSISGEGTNHKLRLNPRGELVVPDFFTQLVLDGRVFNISNEVQEGGATALIGETAPGTNNVNPSILVDVPTGTTIIPLEAMVMAESTGTSGDWVVVRINTDDTTRYSSGGNALTPINMRKDDVRSSNCVCKDGSSQITAAANTDDDIIWMSSYDYSVRAGERLEWTARQYTPPVLIGPASLLVYVDVNNVDEEILFSVKWAEFQTTEIT